MANAERPYRHVLQVFSFPFEYKQKEKKHCTGKCLQKKPPVCRKIMALIYKTQSCFLNKKCLMSLVFKVCSHLMKPTNEPQDQCSIIFFPYSLFNIFFQVSLSLLIAAMKLYGRNECVQVKIIFLFINSHSLHQRKYNKPVLSKHHCFFLKFIVQFSLFPYRSYT